MCVIQALPERKTVSPTLGTSIEFFSMELLKLIQNDVPVRST